MIQNISVLGSTGSIGIQTLEVAKSLGIKVKALAAKKNIHLLEQQAREFRPDFVSVYDEDLAKELRIKLSDTCINVFGGMDGVCRTASYEKSDRVVAAIVGMDGILPVVSAILANRDICLANKETLVTAGDLIMPLAKQRNVKIIPVDSEHSAIFQCLGDTKSHEVSNIILTASGGAFKGRTADELEKVTLEDALKHPNWDMGAKITIDSATLMNKGFEVIEAKCLFDMDVDRIITVIHPESIVHSAVEFIDGSIIAQMGLPDMRLPIQLALTWPERKQSDYKRLSLFDLSGLTFLKPDQKVFGCLKLAYEAAKDQGNMKIVLNAANDVAVESFLNGKIRFTDIYRIISGVMERYPNKKATTLQEILDSVSDCRAYVHEFILKGNYNRMYL